MKNTKISQVNVEAGQSASLPTRHSLNPSARRAGRSLFMAAILSLLLIPAAQLQSKAQAIEPEYVPLNAEQLDQLVAPIALDPDPLVAQILIGCTFPDQVGDANNWLNTKMSLTPDQRATAANSMSWDPSIKGLIVFPVVLDSMAKNNAWTTQLGNAYYNQPDDVMDAIQAMRSLAYQSHALIATSQQNVVVDAELIEILPANPDVVFVQYYNPWTVFGTEVVAYPGYVVEPVPAGVVVAEGVSFEPAVSVGLDAHFGFSFGGWAPGWGGGAVVYNHNVYNSNSRTVANRGHFGGHDGRRFDNRGHEERAGYRRGMDRRGMDHRGLDRRSTDRRGFGSRPMPQRISNNRSKSSLGSTSTSHSSGIRSGARGTSNARTNSTSHPTSTGRPASSNHSNTANRPAARNASTTRSNSTGRSTTPSHSNSTSRSLGSNHSMSQSGSAERSQASNRSISQNRSASPSINRSNPAGRSVPASQSMNRSGGANSSFGANRPASNPASANHSVGGNQSMNRPASPSHSGGAGFSGAHMGGGKKK